MGDQPATKKDIAALQKQIDEINKLKKSSDNEMKMVLQELSNLSDRIDNHSRLFNEMDKG